MEPCLLDEHDLWMVQGDNDPAIKWLFLDSEAPDVLSDMTGWILELEVSWQGGGGYTLRSDSAPELIVDLATSTLTWAYTPQRSAAMPIGRISRYFLRRLFNDHRRTLVEAFIDVKDDPHE